MKYTIILVALLAGCASGTKVKPLSEPELDSYSISCARRDQQIAELRQQQEAQKLPKLEDMSDTQRLINGHIKSKLWALRLECQNTTKR